MADESFLTWPFFDAEHRRFAAGLEAWSAARIPGLVGDHRDVDGICRTLVTGLGAAGWLQAVVPEAYGGLRARLDVRTICLAREILARHDGLADFAFAMQGLGTGAISLFGSDALKARWLPPVAQGRSIAAFALTEPDAGSDASQIAMTATLDGDHYVLDGSKTWISNGGIADHYVVFARTGEAPGAKGITAFVVPGDAAGLTVTDRIAVIAPHPLATLRFDRVRIPASHRIGPSGGGFKVAMATLDVFRSSVGAAALGFARRALDEALDRSANRMVMGERLADLQMTQAKIADAATAIDASALLIYRAAWTKDQGAARITREASMAKMYATEAAQQVVDAAVQLFGGLGVQSGQTVERLYREIRALRIYEGATEVQKIVIARQTQAARATAQAPAHAPIDQAAQSL